MYKFATSVQVEQVSVRDIIEADYKTTGSRAYVLVEERSPNASFA